MPPSPLEAEQVPVADEPVAEQTVAEQAVAEPETTAATEENLLAEFSRYRRLIAEGTLDEADVAAKRIVEMAIKIYGPQSRETASALNNLGIVQHSNGQFDAAVQNFTAAIEIIEAVEDRLNTALVNPLKGLGAAQIASGQPGEANQTFERAAHITHVNAGPHNIDQVEILESIAEAQLRMGNTKQARTVLDRIHILNVRFFEEDPMGLIPSLMNRAAWQHRAGYYTEERASYRRAIRIIESSDDNNNPMLIEPLVRLGESFYFIDLNNTSQQAPGLTTTGEMYFKRADRIASRNDDLDWRIAVDAKLSLADYYAFSEAQNRARKLYKQVWEELSSDEERTAYRTELFSNPVPIRQEALPNFAGSSTSRSEVNTGIITVSYSVTPRGRVRDIRTEASPIEFNDMQRMVHREIRQRVFRPRVVDGAPVLAADQTFEHKFSYAQEELDLRKEQNAAAAQQASAKK